MVKHKEYLEQVVQNFLDSEGLEYTAILGPDFEYEFVTDNVYFAVLVPSEMDKWFMEFAKENGLEYDCGSFLLSLLHEVGHGETYDLLTDAEEKKCRKIKSKLTDSKEDSFTYFALPDEYEATMWAIEYVNEHKDKLEKFVKKFQKVFKEFLKENEVDA